MKILMCIFGLTGILSACTVGPSHSPQVLPTPNDWKGGAYIIQNQEQNTPAQWWTLFNDSLLNHFVEKVLRNNHNLGIAQARIAEARALRGESLADQLPNVAAKAQATRIRTSRNDLGADVFSTNLSGNRYQIGFDAAWELDFFGKNRRATEAANADLAAQEADFEALRITLAAEVTRNYLELRGLQTRRNITKKSLNGLQQLAKLTELKSDLGLIHITPLTRIQAELKIREADLYTLNAEIEQNIHRFNILIGHKNAVQMDQLQDKAVIPFYDNQLQITVPAKLLRHRPDIIASEQELAAATARIGVATADLYPRLTLLGQAGYLSSSTGELIQKNSLLGLVGPEIYLPLFNGGRIRAQIAAADARAQQALLRFEQTMLSALQETESALSAWQGAQQQGEAHQAAFHLSEKNVEIVKQRHERGLDSFIEVLDTQQFHYITEDQYATSKVASGIALIVFLKATAGAIGAVD